MKAQILIRRHITARHVSDVMKIIKTKYPFARLITYKYDEDFRYSKEKDYETRTMTVAFVDDFRGVRDEL